MPDPDPPDDLRLIEQVRAGDAAAADRLFGRHLPYLRRLVELRLDPRLRARVDPSDVLQEAHLEAVRRLAAYLDEPALPFRLWLRRIAYDRLVMLHRRHALAERRALARDVALPDHSAHHLAGQLLAGGSTPSRRVVRDELAQRVRAAVARMADPDREVLVLRTVEGLSNGEVAGLLGIEPVAASQRYGRALLRLRKLLVQDGTAEPGP